MYKHLSEDIILVIASILIPIAIIKIKIELDANIVPIFIILYVFFRFLNNNAHRQYLCDTEKN